MDLTEITEMETFTELKELVGNPHYQDQRQRCLAGLSDDVIDLPMIGLISTFNSIPYCFTMQSCYGHFLYNGQKDIHNLDPLPAAHSNMKVEYRIAYIAFCIDKSDSGRRLLESLKEITAVYPENIQLCCAEWFWERQVNSYVLQVEPDR